MLLYRNLFLIILAISLSGCGIVHRMRMEEETAARQTEDQRYNDEAYAKATTALEEGEFFKSLEILATNKHDENGLVTYTLTRIGFDRVIEHYGVNNTYEPLYNPVRKNVSDNRYAKRPTVWMEYIIAKIQSHDIRETAKKMAPDVASYVGKVDYIVTDGKRQYGKAGGPTFRGNINLVNVTYLPSQEKIQKLHNAYIRAFNACLDQKEHETREFILKNYGNPLTMQDVIKLFLEITKSNSHSTGFNIRGIISCTLRENGICETVVSGSKGGNVANVMVRSQIDKNGVLTYFDYFTM